MGKRLEEIKANPYKFIKSIAMDIVVVLVAVAYIFYQMVRLEKTDVSILVLLAEAMMGIICGIVIKQALGEKGFVKGYDSNEWKEEEEKYNAACNTATNYTDRVDNFYIALEQEKRMNYRRNHLQAYRMRYNDWFNKDGDYIGTEEDLKFKNKALTFKQKWMLKKCIRVRIYILNLFSEYAVSSEQDTQPEMTDKRQRKRNFGKNATSAVLIAIIGVYFIPILDTWSWASLIASTMQVTLWVLFGILQLYTNFNFVTQDKVSILRRKKELISRFVKDCGNGMYIRSIYDEEEPLLIEQKG